jgi:hypothetical protein
VDEDHRRLLEVVEDEAEPPKMKDHRELQGNPFSEMVLPLLNFAVGQAVAVDQ